MKQKRAWIYARDHRGTSQVNRQIRELADEAKICGYEVVGISWDTSYRHILKRRGLHRMMKAIHKGEVDIVVAESVSKLSHQGWLLDWIICHMAQHNVELETTHEDAGYALYLRGLKGLTVARTCVNKEFAEVDLYGE